jgi:hypothetical protein
VFPAAPAAALLAVFAAGTANAPPHFGHFTFLPAYWSGAAKPAPHEQTTLIGITIPGTRLSAGRGKLAMAGKE